MVYARSLAITGVAAGSPSSMAVASSGDFFGRESGARRDAAGSTWNITAGPLMVFSMPFSTSTTPLILLDGVGHLRRPVSQQFRVRRKQLDLDRFRRAGQIADHVLQNLDELHVQQRFLLWRSWPATSADDFVDAAAALSL